MLDVGMKRAIPLLLLLALPAVGEELARPVSDQVRFFRLVVGDEKPLTVLGFIDESGGTGRGYDRAVLDLDGDGVPESLQEFTSLEPFFGEGERAPLVFLRIVHGEATYELTVHGLSGPARRSGDYHSSWSVRRAGLALSFMSSRSPLHDSLEQAKTGKPIRLGGPFRFRARTRIEGPNAVLDVNLQDSMAGELNGATRQGKKEQIRVRLLRGEDLVEEGRLDYG